MKRVYYHYGERDFSNASFPFDFAHFDFPLDAALEQIALRIGTNAIIVSLEQLS